VKKTPVIQLNFSSLAIQKN